MLTDLVRLHDPQQPPLELSFSALGRLARVMPGGALPWTGRTVRNLVQAEGQLLQNLWEQLQTLLARGHPLETTVSEALRFRSLEQQLQSPRVLACCLEMYRSGPERVESKVIGLWPQQQQP